MPLFLRDERLGIEGPSHPCRQPEGRVVEAKPDKHAGCRYLCLDNLGGGLERSQLHRGLMQAGIEGLSVSPFLAHSLRMSREKVVHTGYCQAKDLIPARQDLSRAAMSVCLKEMTIQNAGEEESQTLNHYSASPQPSLLLHTSPSKHF